MRLWRRTGALVFVFLTWHILSVAGSMMAGAVSLSLADAVYPAVLGSRAAGAGVVTGGAVGAAAVGAGRWAIDRLRVHTSLHTATAELPRAHPPGEPATVAPPPPPDPDRTPSNSGSARAKAAPPASSTRDPGAPSPDRETPPAGPAEETDDRKRNPPADT
jgi:hypothetical protein